MENDADVGNIANIEFETFETPPAFHIEHVQLQVNGGREIITCILFRYGNSVRRGLAASPIG